MTKEDFQHVGKIHQSLSTDQYPSKIVEGNEKLIEAAYGGGNTDGGGRIWKAVERPALPYPDGQDRTKSGSEETPWHALAAVKRLESPKELTGSAGKGCDQRSDPVVKGGSGK